MQSQIEIIIQNESLEEYCQIVKELFHVYGPTRASETDETILYLTQEGNNDRPYN